MVALPPDDLKPIRPFIQRGNQMVGADPVITYYCYYWAVKVALDQKLHNKSQEAMQYMLELMEDLEKRKEALSGNELVTDDMAAQAYVENFALKVFNNGSSAVEERRATQKTPEALLAAAVFLELLKIFADNGELDPETGKKIKYAKFHAARILKALREGKDPNPAPETPPAAEPEPTTSDQPIPRQPTVEDVPDDFYTGGASSHSTAPPPPSIPAISDPTSSTLPGMESDTHSSTSQPQHQEYFPQVPTVHEPSAPTLSPITMGPANTAFPDINHADHSYPPPPPEPTQSLTSFPTSTSTGPPPMGAPQQPVFQSPSLPTLPSQFYTGAPSPMVSAPQSPPSTHGQFQPSTSHQQQQEYRPRKEVTPEDMVKAQKFAKWAVSALDYEDVENAIEQFRNGLKALGAL